MIGAAETKCPPLDHIDPGIQHLAVPVGDMQLDPDNARHHPEGNLEHIKRSLEARGQYRPIVVQSPGMIVRAGNGVLMAARQLGWSHVAAIVREMTDAEATALALADNRTAETSEWDQEMLEQSLVLLHDEAPELLETLGWDAKEIEGLVHRGTGSEAMVEDEPPEELKEPPASVLGDLWILGDHRLLCGDSTKLEDVERVMDGDKAALCATDPPYLVDYTGDRPEGSGKDWTESYIEVSEIDADRFFRALFANVVACLADHAPIYCWHAHRRGEDIQRVWRDIGIIDNCQVIWVKPSPVFTRTIWRFRHEPCLVGWRKGSMPEMRGGNDGDTVWEIDWEGKARIVGNEHPTQKPLEIFARPMRRHTAPGDVVFEPFSGSGSQLVAAEKLGRRCRAIELSPTFVDVGLLRWQKAANKEAVLQETGETYEQVASRRRAEAAKKK